MFILYTADLPEALKAVAEEGIVSVLLYADDLVIYSKDRDSIQKSLVALERYCDDFKLEVNVKKTKAIKFRRGGRLKSTDTLWYKNTSVEFVNSFEYLGVTLQPTWTFTNHIRTKRIKCMARLCMVKNLPKLSIDCANKLFNIVLKPIITYAIKSFWYDLTARQIKMLDACQWMFYKRVLGLPINAKNRKIASVSYTHLTLPTKRIV